MTKKSSSLTGLQSSWKSRCRRSKPVSDDTIREWLKRQKIRLRKIQKTKACGSSPDRDAQFQNIADQIAIPKAAGNPVFSVDTKAKEFLGKLFHKGRSWCSQAPVAFDQDFPSKADGVLIPQGIDDLLRNRGHINLGLSHDPREFACESLRWYWNRIGGVSATPTRIRSCYCSIAAVATRRASSS